MISLFFVLLLLFLFYHFFFFFFFFFFLLSVCLFALVYIFSKKDNLDIMSSMFFRETYKRNFIDDLLVHFIRN